MSRAQRIRRAVYESVREINRQLPADSRLIESPETELLGGTTLDSLGLLSLLSEVEARAGRVLSTPPRLTDGELIGVGETGPLRTLGSLIAYLVELETAPPGA